MKYLDWYDKEEALYTSDKKEITVLNLIKEDNNEILNEWANHFRSNYRSLEDLEYDVEDTGKTKEEYLTNDVFPDKTVAPGPSTRVGDFCDLLVADYIEFVRNYYVPRTRYCRKINRVRNGWTLERQCHYCSMPIVGNSAGGYNRYCRQQSRHFYV